MTSFAQITVFVAVALVTNGVKGSSDADTRQDLQRLRYDGGDLEKVQREGDNSVTDTEMEDALNTLEESLQAELAILRKETEESIAAVMALTASTSWEVSKHEDKINSNYNDLAAVDSGIAGRVGTLENLYETATVRKCYVGVIENACLGHCNWKGRDYAGTTTRVTFPAPFHKTPSVTMSLYQYDDTDTSFRFSLTNTQNTHYMDVKLGTWSISRIYSAAVRWIACA